jgi:hypothetical protein
VKIGLIDVDSKYPNLALMKISAWYKSQNHNIKWWNAFEVFDLIYASQVFTKSKNHYLPKNCVIGGSGVSLESRLSEEIEHIYPDYNLYKIDYAMGYLTRGCINKCPFCIVWRKEGNLHKHAALQEFWHGQEKLMLLDNALTDYDHAEVELEQIRDEGLRLNLTQGFNIRTIKESTASILADIYMWEKYSQWHISWDNINEESMIRQGLDLLERVGIRPYKMMCYVLCGFNTTPDQDLYRIKQLKEWGIDPFVMPFRKSPYLNALTKWCNRKQLFGSCSFEQYAQSKGIVLI